MKKTLSAIIFSLLATTASAKDGVYISADLISSYAKYKFDTLYEIGQSNRVSSRNQLGVGATLGYKKSITEKFFIAPEIFYDYLNSSTKDYHYAIEPYGQDTMEIRSRYGIKANFGYNFTQKFSTYLTYGIAALDHVDNFPSVSDSKGKWKTAAIYGIGSIYNFSNNWGIKAEFNSQRFNTIYYYYPSPTTTSKVRLNVLKLGLVYSF